jgi:hypothetical protein
LHEDPNTQPSGDLERSEAVRRLNAQLREIMKWLPHDCDHPYTFFCECGCCEPGQLTIAEYDALEGQPIYLDGHAPLEKHYCVTIRRGDESTTG